MSIAPETVAILASWAGLLSGYPTPDAEVQFAPHEFFVERSCGGVDCNVVGAYFDAEAPHVVYIDEKYRDDKRPFVLSLIVHELVHAAQWQSGEFDSTNCEQSLQRERQAYYVQNEYLVRNGHMPVIRSSVGVCAK